MERIATFEIKEVGSEGTVTGYASTFGNKDQGGDIVLKGAFLKSLSSRPVDSIPMLWNHNSDEVIGTWSSAYEDEYGLFIKGKINTHTARGKDIHALLKGGSKLAFSIGFLSVNSDYSPKDGARKLQEVDLREVSIVTFPMNEEARIIDVKSTPTVRELEAALVGAGLTDKQAKALLNGGHKKINLERDAQEDKQEQRDADYLLQAVKEIQSKSNKGSENV